MVRLLLRWAVSSWSGLLVSIPQWYDYYLFQSLDSLSFEHVSIPQWYDYYGLVIATETAAYKFQFLNGTIITLLSMRAACSILVSIPQWYDYYFYVNKPHRGIGMFQFLNGTIITKSRK